MSEYGDRRRLTPGGIMKLVLAVVILFGALPFFGGIAEHLDAQQVMVIQYINGTMKVHTEPGWKFQWWGKATKYDKRSQYWFSKLDDQGDKTDQSIKVRFNDGGHATLSGSIAWEIPTAEKSLLVLHSKYGDQHSLEQQLVRTIVEKAVYMTGPLMSSKESYAERRNDLIRCIEDQVQLGIYQTQSRAVKEPDPMTGIMKTVTYVELVMDDKGVVLRQEESPLSSFGIHTFNLSLNSIDYDPGVEAQIQAQQKAIMDVQTAMATAKKAEQDAITAAKNGEAKAAEAKWAQEVEKAKAVTKAEQELEVAKLERQAAEQAKQKQILLGQGEAESRRLVMAADNALDARLEAYIKVNERYAQALENIKVPIVPNVQMGSSSNGQSNVQQFMDLLMAKTARELGISSNPGAKN